MPVAGRIAGQCFAIPAIGLTALSMIKTKLSVEFEPTSAPKYQP